METLNKLSLPVTILIACLILGGFYFLTERNKQASIEQQQQVEQAAKLEQDKKDYAAKQKAACLDIYTTEGKKWTNVAEWDYKADTDKCEITYKDPKKKTKAECDKDLADAKEIFKGELLPPSVFMAFLRCVDGVFVKEF